jgi:hypothetical protein
MNQQGVQAVHVGYEAYGAQADLDYFNERMEVEQVAFPIEELKWPRDGEASKEDRVQRLGPDLRSHRFYVPSLILHQGKACLWKLEQGNAGGLELKYTPQSGLTSLMQRVTNEGSPHRVCKQLARVDSDGGFYDVTRHFIEQVMLYPVAPLKDLVDAASRIFDMDPRPPVLVEERDTLPEVYADGV